MNPVTWVFYLSAAGCSWALTWLIRRVALAKNMLDVPNDRSSHVIPTPRGGGLAFVLTFLGFMTYLFFIQNDLFAMHGYLMLAALLVAWVGFWDDIYHLAIMPRLLGHIVAAVLLLYGIHGLPAVVLCDYLVLPSVIVYGLALLYVIWLLNLYNFMDGIDGIAGLEAITVSAVMAFIYWANHVPMLMTAPLLLVMTIAGFFYWNAPYARIFMGDAGSGFLGVMLAGFSLQSLCIDVRFFYCWLILLAVFITDASLTLCARTVRGETIFQAHRSHAYQHAAVLFGKHYLVTASVGLINLLWLCPIALAVSWHYLDGVLALVLAYVPMLGLAICFKAGRATKYF